MSYNVLVTAGDTFEAVDDVRRLTHMATGRLGSQIADAFADRGFAVTYLCGQTALRPRAQMADIQVIAGVESLMDTMNRLLTQTPYDAVIHSMAVSDYTVRGVTTESAMAAAVATALAGSDGLSFDARKALALEAIHNSRIADAKKLSSDLSDLMILLDAAPKVISIVKQLRPETLLVGFKLLAGVTEEELIRAAARQFQNSGCDYILANDLETIEGDRHQGLLLTPGGVVARPRTKAEIAGAIAQQVLADLNRRAGS